jgi:hypothetical protein
MTSNAAAPAPAACSAEAEPAALLDVVGIVVQHRHLVAARVEQARDHLADAAQAGEDDLARLRRLGGTPGRLERKARGEQPVVHHEQKWRCEHGQRNREHHRLRGFSRQLRARGASAEQHESELPALREQQHEERPLARRDAGKARDRPQDHALDGEQAGDDAEHLDGCLEQYPEVDSHADRYEEQAEQQTLERLDRGLDLVPVFGLREQHAGEKRAQRHRQASRFVAERDAEHEQQRERGEDLAQPGARDMPEYRAREVMSQHQRRRNRGARIGEVVPGKVRHSARGAE